MYVVKCLTRFKLSLCGVQELQGYKNRECFTFCEMDGLDLSKKPVSWEKEVGILRNKFITSNFI